MGDEDPRIPALQLLLGEATEADLSHVLKKAFGEKVVIIDRTDAGWMHGMCNTALNRIGEIRERALGPPLGKLVCENIAHQAIEIGQLLQSIQRRIKKG